jgi:SHS2 domain-containing protein
MAHQIYPSLKTYEFIEHTADIRIRVKGRDLKSIFKNSACAMFDIMAVKRKEAPPRGKTLKLTQQAANKEELFLCWLNELLFLSAAKGLVFEAFNIKRIDEGNIEAEVRGESIDNYKIETEIKAATFSSLILEKSGSGWMAEVVFDV